MTDVSMVLVTVPADAGVRIGRALVEEGLIACANLLPGVTSVFRWEGRIQEEKEALLVLKTERSRLTELLRRVPELHPYDVPEVLAIPVERGHPPYLAWVSAETRPGGKL